MGAIVADCAVLSTNGKYYLANKSDQLRDLAVNAIVKFAATRAMANTMEAIGAQVGAMVADEMVEGLTRRELAGMAAQCGRRPGPGPGRRGRRPGGVRRSAGGRRRHPGSRRRGAG